jgi:hypothetical protein
VNFVVVPDGGAPIGSSSYEQGDPSMGDIRVGGYNFGTNTLAAAYQPPPVNNYSIAGAGCRSRMMTIDARAIRTDEAWVEPAGRPVHPVED